MQPLGTLQNTLPIWRQFDVQIHLWKHWPVFLSSAHVHINESRICPGRDRHSPLCVTLLFEEQLQSILRFFSVTESELSAFGIWIFELLLKASSVQGTTVYCLISNTSFSDQIQSSFHWWMKWLALLHVPRNQLEMYTGGIWMFIQLYLSEADIFKLY